MTENNTNDTKYEQEELFQLRIAISNLIGSFRSRYGNKDGVSTEGEYKRYNDPYFASVEEHLDNAQRSVFEAGQVLALKDRRAKYEAMTNKQTDKTP